jgi:Domain of unknown function (DUF4157)
MPAPYGIDFVDRSSQSATHPAPGSAATRPNGLPDRLKHGIESLSGMELSDVRVHRDSPKPARINALAYAQGSEIHLGPGHERHLPHEAWHIVQQRQGRVRTNLQMKGVAVNDDPGLEREADLMGERALSTTTYSSPGGAISPQSPVGSAPIQRKVGFEFEDARWNPWYLGYLSRLYPAARKAVLHQGMGFNLEADDTPGPNKSNIEFVTDAFDATDDGRRELKTTLTQIRGLYRNRLNPLVGAVGPVGQTSPYAFDATRLVGSAQHQLTGPAYGRGQHLYLSGGKVNGSIKMQATAGARLSDLPLVMKYFGSAQPTESPTEKAERDPARTAMVGDPVAAAQNAILRVIGGTPAVAQAALALIANSASLSALEQGAFTAGTDDVTGFLSALILTMKMVQLPLDEVVKYRDPILFRTDFANLFAAIPDNQRAILTAHPQVLIDCVISASNTHPLVRRTQGIDPDTGLTQHSSLIRSPLRQAYAPNVPMPHESFAGLSIAAWINGMIQGVDYLTPDGINTWLKTQGWWWWQRPNLVKLLESFGSIGGTDRAPGHGSKLAVFENRGLTPTGIGGQLSIDEALKVAWNQFLFYLHIEESHDWESEVGAYPDESPF